MSSKVVVDPDELERFARELKRFNSQLRSSTSRLQGQYKSLGSTWRDQEHAKFAREFEQTMRTLNQFMKSAEAHTPFLLKKAQRAREYLRQR